MRIQQELNVLNSVSHPFIVNYFGAFDVSFSFSTLILSIANRYIHPRQSKAALAMIFEYAVGGELYHRLKQVYKISEQEAMFYFVEIASVVRYLHEDMNIVYR